MNDIRGPSRRCGVHEKHELGLGALRNCGSLTSALNQDYSRDLATSTDNDLILELRGKHTTLNIRIIPVPYLCLVIKSQFDSSTDTFQLNQRRILLELKLAIWRG